MSWILYSLLANVCFGLTVILDKFLNTKKIKSVYSFAIILNLIYLFFILITTYIQRDTFIFNSGAIYSVIAGVFWFFMWICFWKAMQKGEATRVSAIFFSQPIYSSLIGVFIFHEVLTPLKWIGILIIVVGAVASSLGGENHKKEVRSAYLFALLSAVFSSIGNSISKYAMKDLPPLTVNCIAFYSTIPLYLFLLKDNTVVKEVKNTFKNMSLTIQFTVRGLFGYMGIILFMTALSTGPISLVTAVSGTQPLFVLVFSVLVSLLYPKAIHEEFNRRVLAPKLAALFLTVAGIIMISL
ncbi:MAG: EamA family transporter [Candidatus Roizmanbacteria bacterium]|nr:EamA family transporter [Candidatus Roizmanbacteria bacterium]